MTKFTRIKDIIRKHNADMDKLASEYKQKEKRAREKFSEQGFKEEFMINTWPKYAGEARGNVDITIAEIRPVFNEIEEDFQRFIMKPIKPDILQTLNLIQQFNLKLSLSELKTIEKSVSDSWFGFRIFSGLAEKAGFLVDIWDMDTFTKEIESARKNTENAVKTYAGKAPDFPGRDLLSEWTYQGINYGEYQTYHLMYAVNFLNDDNCVLNRLENMFDTLKAPIKYELRKDEKEEIMNKVDSIIDPYGGAVDKEKANKLEEEIPDILSRLESISDDLPNKKTAIEYFTLRGIGAEQKAKENASKNQSKINQTAKNAKEYGTRFQKVDAEMLRQYE